jgi:hypothetical protein
MSEDELRTRITRACERLMAEAVMEGDAAKAKRLRELRDSFNRPKAPMSATDVLRHPLEVTVH